MQDLHPLQSQVEGVLEDSQRPHQIEIRQDYWVFLQHIISPGKFYIIPVCDEETYRYVHTAFSAEEFPIASEKILELCMLFVTRGNNGSAASVWEELGFKFWTAKKKNFTIFFKLIMAEKRNLLNHPFAFCLKNY